MEVATNARASRAPQRAPGARAVHACSRPRGARVCNSFGDSRLIASADGPVSNYGSTLISVYQNDNDNDNVFTVTTLQ